MITSITLENFKCFRKVEVNPRRITVFIGPNGTGKSSVLQAMALLKQSVGRRRFETNGPLVNLQSDQKLLPSFLPNSQYTRFGLSGNYIPPASELENLEEPAEFSCDVQVVGQNLNHLQPNYSADWSTVARALQELKMVPAARSLTQPVYPQSPQILADIPLAESLDFQAKQTASNLLYTQEVQSKISNWTKRVTGVGLLPQAVPPQSVELKADTPGGWVNIVAEGFGTSSLIMLFLVLASAEKGATVMIEEPEIHLHPKAQAELASVLVEEAQAEDKQIIMTTHSEHIPSRLLTLLAEGTLAVDELAIYAFEKDEKGECTANRLAVTDDGRVQGGIKDFFDTDLQELERYINALRPKE